MFAVTDWRANIITHKPNVIIFSSKSFISKAELLSYLFSRFTCEKGRGKILIYEVSDGLHQTCHNKQRHRHSTRRDTVRGVVLITIILFFFRSFSSLWCLIMRLLSAWRYVLIVIHKILTQKATRISSNNKVKPEIIELNNLEARVFSSDKQLLETSRWDFKNGNYYN